MPKSPLVPLEVLQTTLLSRSLSEYYNDKKCLHPPSHNIWTIISEELEKKISPKYIYTVLKENRKNILSTIRNNDIQTNCMDSETISCVSSSDSLSDKDIGNSIKFNITLSIEEWSKIRPKTVQYSATIEDRSSERTYRILEPGQWTFVIHDHVYEQTKVICKLVYKRAKVYSYGNNFLVIDGSCSVCQSNFKGILEKEPDTDSRAVIKCTYVGNFKNCSGNSKRRLIGTLRSNAINRLTEINSSASFIRRNEASRIMNFGDTEPSHLPTLNALRILKCRSLKKNQDHEDPILGLSILKGSLPYSLIIRDIGYDRFFVHYWSAVQINVYRQYFKNTAVPLISIDATGGVVKKPLLISGRKTKSIFFYEIAVHDGKNQFPVSHMLSERHDNNSISHWLLEWTRDGAPAPKIVVTDQSIALMSACVRSFTQYSDLSMYLEVCSALILSSEKYSLPNCFIRNDIAHVIKLLTTWKELKGLTYRIKNFYMRSIGLVITSTSYDDAKYLLKQIFTVALNETDGTNITTGVATECDLAKTYLKNRIANHEVILVEEHVNDGLNNTWEINEENVSEGSNPTEMNSIYNNSLILSEITIMFDECKIKAIEGNDEGTHENMQFNPGLAKKLKDFCKFLPIWSAVMVPIFKYGALTQSSASSESLFNDLKNRIFQHKTLPLRIDEFIKTHIKTIDGTMILSSNDTNRFDLIDQPLDASEHSDTSPACIACKNGDIPTGAHKCCTCFLNIHILDGCSVSVGNEEGYGEKRQCMYCYKLKKPEVHENLILENWRNEALQSKSKKQKTYLDKDPTILWYNDGSRTKSRTIGILRNGSISTLSRVLIEKKSFLFTNTCAFDTLVHALYVSVCDSKTYGEFVKEQQENLLLFKMIFNAIRDGINVQTYRKRGIILKSINEEKISKSGDIFHIDCQTTIEELVSKLFKDYPSRTYNSSRCKKCSSVKSPYLMATLDQFQNLQSKIEPGLYKDCICYRRKHGNIGYEKHLFILTNKVVDFNKVGTSNYINGVPTKLKNIPKRISLDESEYKLRGAIELKTSDDEYMGHYVFNGFREEENRWYLFDDLCTTALSIKEDNIIVCEMLLYTK